LRTAVVFLVREDMADIYPSQIITHIYDQSVFVAPYIENCTPLSQKTSRGKILAGFMRSGIALLPHDREPGSKRSFCIWMILPEFLESLPSDYMHSSSANLMLPIWEHESRMSRVRIPFLLKNVGRYYASSQGPRLFPSMDLNVPSSLSFCATHLTSYCQV
jgi:hypothetical protein